MTGGVGSASERKLRTRLARALVVGCAIGVVSAGTASAAPSGGSVVGGQAGISQSGNTTVIDQSTQKAIIDWHGGFNVGSGEGVEFRQPGTSSITLNRVKKQGKSSIDGDINAPGRVWIVNPDGVLIGANARVTVGGFLASTADISNQDFLDGNYAFSKQSANTLAAIINRGSITVGPDGHVILVGPRVVNSGSIHGTLSTVVLGGVPQFRIDLDGDGLIQFEATGELQDALANTVPVTNTGDIEVDGGTILLTVSAAFQLVTTAINTTGLIEANATEFADGRVILQGGTSGQVKIAGETRANADEPTDGLATVVIDGLRILISNTVEATDGVSIDAKHVRTEGDGVIRTANLDLDSSVRGSHPIGGTADLRTVVDTLAIGRREPTNRPFDAVTLNNDGNLTVDGADVGSLTLNVGGNLTIRQPVTATGTGDAVVLVADRFINQAGTTGVSTPQGRSLIYSVDPRQDERGGLPGRIVYNGSISSTPPGNITYAGNVFIYEVPTVPVVTPPTTTTTLPTPIPTAPPPILKPLTLSPYQYAQGSSAGSRADKSVTGPDGLVEVVPVPVDKTEDEVLYANDGNLDLWDLSGGR